MLFVVVGVVVVAVVRLGRNVAGTNAYSMALAMQCAGAAVTERTKEEKRREENGSVVIAANMLLLDSNARFPLLRWRSVTEAIIARPAACPKEKNARPRKEETSKAQFFVMPLSFLFLRFYHPSRHTVASLGDESNDRSSGCSYVCVRVCVYLHIWVCGCVYWKSLRPGGLMDRTTIWQDEKRIAPHLSRSRSLVIHQVISHWQYWNDEVAE